MPVIEGVVDFAGNEISQRGDFEVVSKTGNLLTVRFPGENVSIAFVLALPWRDDGDIGQTGVSASPDLDDAERMLFAVDDYYGLSFRVDTDAVAGDPPAVEIQSRGWSAWVDRRGARPELQVAGEVLVSNPGIELMILPREPQGINPRIFLVDLFLHQLPGFWPQVLSWKPVRYRTLMTGDEYDQVDIQHESGGVAVVPVEDAG